MALAICTAAAMYSCSLDEYNPSDTSGEGELKTVVPVLTNHPSQHQWSDFESIGTHTSESKL